MAAARSSASGGGYLWRCRAWPQCAEAEQQRNAFPGNERHKRWGKGTHDAFVIALLAQAFDLDTTYTPESPLIQAYQGLLAHWHTTDLATFQQAMAPAVAFHLARGRYSTDKVEYEFNSPFDRVFPAELLLVQALRQRDGLPAFASGHALVDAPGRQSPSCPRPTSHHRCWPRPWPGCRPITHSFAEEGSGGGDGGGGA